ncbi:hypothetical protein M422DRAFT_30262 [Sphaerobolus stellatus SS14]|uniref:Uncharacterized protein n=1 Tax=Sphaerobolus stellatus (strain SS14) TaxID=990650 RepID=A0A0C9W078_SPHS4|nr:hypothetical protein M422DRAFT_30262 [Sphaerobolus stellatus SS14]
MLKYKQKRANTDTSDGYFNPNSRTRRRVESPAEGPMPVATSNSKLYHRDGSIVLVTEEIAFKVH